MENLNEKLPYAYNAAENGEETAAVREEVISEKEKDLQECREEDLLGNEKALSDRKEETVSNTLEALSNEKGENEGGALEIDQKRSLEEEILKLKEENARQRAEFDRAIRQIHIERAVKDKLCAEGARNPEILLKLIDSSAAEIGENGDVIGIDEQISALKSNEPYLFREEKPVSMGCFRPEEAGDFSETDFSQMTYSQMIKAINNN